MRGIASGTRDTHGNLIRYKLHDPAPYLADALGDATPLYRTWVAGGVYRIVRRDFRWGDAPALGLPNPDKLADVPPTMRIYALERSLSREERMAASATGGNELVGRDAEKADLHAAYHQAVSAAGGGGQVVHRAIVGELGIGKTALVSAFAAELPPNARIVRAECSPVRMEVPLSVVADLVRDAIGVTGDEPFDEVADLVARAGGGAAHGDASSPVVARLAELATNRQIGDADEDAQFRKRSIASGLRNLLGAIGLTQPVVVVIESLQWADKQSLEALGELMRQPDPLPILFVLVTRPDDRISGLLEGVVRIELAGLSSDEQVRLVETRLGARDGVRAVLGDLMPRVGGNPFFLLEMVDALLERGSLELREVSSDDGETRPVLAYAKGGGREGVQLPSTLEQLLSDRLRELPTEEHVIVDWLAIAGGPLATSDLEKLAPKIQEDAVVRLCARGLCDRKGDHVDFRHPLTRDVAYSTMAAEDRIHMHRALGEHLKTTSLARGLSAAIVARHLARGEAGEEAAELYAEAGHAARAGNQTQLAMRYLRRATLHLGQSDPRQLGLLAELETLYRMLGRRRERIEHLGALRRIARKIGTPRATCIALLRTARYYFDEGRLSAGLPVAKLAAEIAHGASMTQLEVEAEALVSEFLRELGDVQGALAACDRALATCNPSAEPGPVAAHSGRRSAFAGCAAPARGPCTRSRWTRTCKPSPSFARRARGGKRRAPRTPSRSRCSCKGVSRTRSRSPSNRSRSTCRSAAGFRSPTRSPTSGTRIRRLGDLPRAQAYLKRARETHERYGDQDNRADTLIVSAETMIEAGLIDEAEVFLRDAAALIEVTDNAYAGTHHGVINAVLAREKREATKAISYALEARRAAEDQTLVSFHFYGMAVEAAARIDAGEMHSATLLATTAFGAVETIQGCEYGLEIRVLCADALKRAGSPQAPLALPARRGSRARSHEGHPRLAASPALREAPIVASLFDTHARSCRRTSSGERAIATAARTCMHFVVPCRNVTSRVARGESGRVAIDPLRRRGARRVRGRRPLLPVRRHDAHARGAAAHRRHLRHERRGHQRLLHRRRT